MGAPICIWDCKTISPTDFVCLIWMWEAVWGGYQPQPSRNGIIFTPQVTQIPKIWGHLCWYKDTRVHPYALETAKQYLKHISYVLYGCGKQSEVDISFNHDVMAHFHSTSDPKVQYLGPTWPVYWYNGAPICPWDSMSIAQTLWICLAQIWEAVWGGYQPQPSRNGIISTPQVTQKFEIWGQLS